MYYFCKSKVEIGHRAAEEGSEWARRASATDAFARRAKGDSHEGCRQGWRSDRIRRQGEVTAGASGINVGNGWSGFAKGTVQFGDENFFGVSGNFGLRKAFLSAQRMGA